MGSALLKRMMTALSDSLLFTPLYSKAGSCVNQSTLPSFLKVPRTTRSTLLHLLNSRYQSLRICVCVCVGVCFHVNVMLNVSSKRHLDWCKSINQLSNKSNNQSIIRHCLQYLSEYTITPPITNSLISSYILFFLLLSSFFFIYSPSFFFLILSSLRF